MLKPECRGDLRGTAVINQFCSADFLPCLPDLNLEDWCAALLQASNQVLPIRVITESQL